MDCKMDVAHGPSLAHNSGVGASPGATSPPPRPAVPPKPDKDKIGPSGSKTNAGVQANFPRRFSADASPPVQPARHSAFASTGVGSPNFRSPLTSSSTDSSVFTSLSPKSPPNQVLTPPSAGASPGSRNKPALPPKPANTSLLVSPPLTKFPQKSPPQLTTPPVAPTTQNSNDNANSSNKNNNNNPSSPTIILSSSVSNGEQNGTANSPPLFLRAKPPQSPGDPLSPRAIPRSPNRPNSSSFFNFSSPIQNLNSSNFPSTSTGLNQSGGNAGPTPPQKLAQIRVKSASLGRNITFPFSAPSSSSSGGGGGGITGIISRKSATLSKFLPLDLHIGGLRPQPPIPNNKPKPNSLNLNPFIIQQKQQQQQQAQLSQQQAVHVHGQAILSFGRSISFSPDSPLPPPPPPRLKKKLSPVNSINSPTSPTSPSPLFSSLSPTSPLPPPPPISPGTLPMEPLAEAPDEKEGIAIYAAVDKQKKWAERKLKQVQLKASSAPPSQLNQNNQMKKTEQANITNSSNGRESVSSHENTIKMNKSDEKSDSVDNFLPHSEVDLASKDANTNDIHMKPSETVTPGECAVVESWLGKYLTQPVNQPSTNPFRSVSPSSYQSQKPGHIYETIGDGFDDGNNNNKVEAKKSKAALEIQETSEVISDELNENQSFLFKLIISQKKANSSAAEESQNEESTKCKSTPANFSNEFEEKDEDEFDAENHSKVICEAVNENICIKINSKTRQEGGVQSSVTDTTTEQQTEVVKKVTSSSPPPLEQDDEEVQHEDETRIPTTTSTSSPIINNYMIPTVVQDLSEKTSPQTEQNERNKTELVKKGDATSTNILEVNELSSSSHQHPPEDSFKSPDEANAPVISPPSRTNSILRRRSWNCDRIGSPSPSESSSTTSSNTNLPYHHARDRSFTCPINNRASLLSREDWIDEDELSNGALADAESSDNVPLRSSAEDVAHLKAADVVGFSGSPSSSPAAKQSFASRRSRFVSSIFGSFGKGSSSSSGGGGAAGGGRKSVAMRHTNAKQRHKEKSNSLFFVSDPLKQQQGSKLGRQISDSVIPTATMISGPILPKSGSFSQEDNNGIPVHKPQSVQFSPEVVAETHIIYHEHSSSEDGMNPGNAIISPPHLLEENERREDNESVSSSESASGCGSHSGSVSGYEDILAELSPKEKKSFYVAREILTSERTFVDVLNLLTIEFPKCLKAAARYHGTQVISDKDMEIILGGLPTLKQVNENLLSDLEERVSHWKEFPKIADILVRTGPFLKMYADYIKDFQKNSLHLDTCCQRYPLFEATIRDFELGERCHKLGLKHYMLKPVQRMPQYRLLLEDYLKSLDKDSEDYNDAVKGIAIVKDVAEHANEAIRLQVNAEKLLHLQSRLTTGTIILKSDRQLIKEGELQKVCRKVLQPRFFALMNDCLFCFTYNAPAGSPKDLKLRYELPLAGMRVSLSSNEDYQNEFSVISVARSFNLVAKTPRERDEWMKALNNAIHDNIKKRSCCTPDQEIGFQLGKEAPVWIQDQRVTMCQLCTAEFTVTFRRHHCRACGKVVCGNCSGNQAPLQYLQNSAARVCDSCYECLLDDFDKLCGLTLIDSDTNRSSIRDRFKKVTLNVSKRATKIKRAVPSRLEVHANSSGSRISGYLQWRAREKKSWKRRWFVLIDRVLYIYAASEDIVAIKSIPILGWHVEMDKSEPQPQETEENQAVFRLTHMGQHPILFQADSIATAERWIAAMSEAVVL